MGELATAKILKVKTTKDRIGGTNRTSFILLEVYPTGKPPFKKEIMILAPIWSPPQEGFIVNVKCIPEKKMVALT